MRNEIHVLGPGGISYLADDSITKNHQHLDIPHVFDGLFLLVYYNLTTMVISLSSNFISLNSEFDIVKHIFL